MLSKGVVISRLGKLTAKLIIFTLLVSLLAPSFVAAAPTQNTADVNERLKLKEKKMAELKVKQQKLARDLSAITDQYQESYNKLIVVSDKVRTSKASLGRASMELKIQQETLNDRLSEIYKSRSDSLLFNFLLSIKSFNDLVSNFKYLNVISDKDSFLVKKTKDMKTSVTKRYKNLQRIKEEKTEIFQSLEIKKDEMQRNLENQNIIAMLLKREIVRLEKVAHQVGNLKIAIVFPVAGPHSYINDWGFPRSGGRTHKGTDVFAVQGTPLVAVTDGYIGKYSPVEKGLGGITVWVYGYDGHHYYYAHMSKVEKGIKVGAKVKAGQIVGYVGNTGNARTTPPHLHFQIHPNGGEPVNPYPFLRAADPGL